MRQVFTLTLICCYVIFCHLAQRTQAVGAASINQEKRCKLPEFNSQTAKTRKSSCRTGSSRDHTGDCCGGFECVDGRCKHSMEAAETTNAEIYASSFAVVSQLLAQDAVHLSQVLKDKVDETAEALIKAEQKLQDLSEAAQEDIQTTKERLHQKIDALDQREGKVKEELNESMSALNKLKEQANKLYMETLGRTSSERVFDSTHPVVDRIDMSLVNSERSRNRETSSADEIADLKRQIKILELRKKLNALKNENIGKYEENKIQEDDNYLNDHEEGNLAEHKQKRSDGSDSDIGTEGGPCGETNYKDFGPCKEKGLTCVLSDVKVAEGWIPGTCKRLGKKSDSENVEMVSFAANHDYWSPGMYMPCGKTSFYDFGACNANFTCHSQAGMPKGMGLCLRITHQSKKADDYQRVFSHLAGYGGWSPGMYMPCGKTAFYDFGQCKANFTCSPQSGMPAGMGLCVERFQDNNDRPPGQPNSNHPAEIAKTASQLAEEIADSSERLAEKLLATAAHLRRAAAKLKGEIESKPVAWEHGQVANFQSLPQEQPAFPYALAFIVIFTLAFGAFWILRRSSVRSSYQKI